MWLLRNLLVPNPDHNAKTYGVMAGVCLGLALWMSVALLAIGLARIGIDYCRQAFLWTGPQIAIVVGPTSAAIGLGYVLWVERRAARVMCLSAICLDLLLVASAVFRYWHLPESLWLPATTCIILLCCFGIWHSWKTATKPFDKFFLRYLILGNIWGLAGACLMLPFVPDSVARSQTALNWLSGMPFSIIFVGIDILLLGPVSKLADAINWRQ